MRTMLLLWVAFGLVNGPARVLLNTESLGPARGDAPTASAPVLDSLPWAERIGLEQAIAAADVRYAARTDEGRPVLETPAGTVASFTIDGAHLDFGGHEMTLRLAAVGRGDALRDMDPAGEVAIVGAEVRTDRGDGITEWWRSLPSGLEHGVTIENRPEGVGHITIALGVGGDLHVQAADGDAVALLDANGEHVATYAHLMVLDAAGAPVPAHMAVDGQRIVLAIDDAAARYPLVVDPLVTAQEAMLVPVANTPNDELGYSVALTSDGSRALVGAPGADTAGGVDAGNARVFLRAGSEWVLEATLVAPDGAAGDEFGHSVALTSDGTRALVGVWLDDTAGGVNAGTARVFVRTGTSWAQEATLLASDGAASDVFGGSVALTSDGMRALVGVSGDDTGGLGAGSARVFLRTGTTWAPEATLLAPDGAASDAFGSSVALTSDGGLALVGVPGDAMGAFDTGSVRVFARVGSAWTQQATLLPTIAGAGDRFGASVAVTPDGVRALVGAPGDDTSVLGAGSANVFLRSGTLWTQEATLLVTAGAAAYDSFGTSVAFTADGSRALVGNPGQNGVAGRVAGNARMFLRTGATWAQEAILSPADGASRDQFGVSVALTADGGRAMVGVYWDDTVGGVDAGSARAFVRTGTAWAREGTLLASGGAYEAFGLEVALTADGSRAVVGAPTYGSSPGGGTARVFVRSGAMWLQETTLVAPDGAVGDAFGVSVALTPDGTRALIGAWSDDAPGGIDAGSARVFLRSGSVWVQEATLLAPGGAPGDRFGASVALTADGSRALVSAPYDDAGGRIDAGSVWVFVQTVSGWTHEATLTAADATDSALLGHDIALTADGTRALVGASGDRPAGVRGGSARVFVRTGTAWTQEAILVASDGASSDGFGHRVALTSDGTRALVGAPFDDTAVGVDAGSAWVFVRTGTDWAAEATLLAPDGARDDGLGLSIALTSDGARALVGAPRGDTVAGANAGSVRVFVRTGTTWALEANVLAPDGAADDFFGGAVAVAADGSRALVGVGGDDTGAGTDFGSARVFTFIGSVGTICEGDAACASGFCVDGVCCSSACAGGVDDCQACSAALTGGADGTCATLSPAVAPTVTCRAPADACDAPETCTSVSATCPEDLLASTTTICRMPASVCDIPETCTGTSAACPPDGVGPSGVECRPGTPGTCDAPELCDGASPVCPADAVAIAGTVCRPEAGACDSIEVCDGRSAVCPGDAFEPMGNVCGTETSDCALPAVCTGTSPMCPSVGVRPMGTPCGVLNGPCDVADSCDGVSQLCLDTFQPVTTLCGAAPDGVCDAPDHCAGTSANCEAVFLVGVECRASAGSCDAPEMCGSAPTCPPDVLVSAGLSCRASTDTSCDPEEVCDGVSSRCPTDLTTCSVRPDVSVDAGTAPPPPVEACSCGVATRPLPVWPLLALLALIACRTRSGKFTTRA